MSTPRALPWPVPWRAVHTPASKSHAGIGLADVALVLDVPRGTVDTWRRRGRAGVPFPTPAHAGPRPRWTPAQVSTWVRAVLDAEAQP